MAKEETIYEVWEKLKALYEKKVMVIETHLHMPPIKHEGEKTYYNTRQ